MLLARSTEGSRAALAVCILDALRHQFIPYLLEDYDLDDWYGSPPTGEVVELQVNDEFINLLKVRQWMNGVVLGQEQNVLDRLDALISRFEAWE